MIKIQAGDTNFQKTLTQCEKDYIHQGQNWISKMAREVSLKALHNYGYTLDQINELSEDERKKVWDEARETWNKKQETNYHES